VRNLQQFLGKVRGGWTSRKGGAIKEEGKEGTTTV